MPTRGRRRLSPTMIAVAPRQTDAEIVRPCVFGASYKNRIRTFRTMETAAVLYRDPALKIHWNQIHLCEVKPHGFNGFGVGFDATLREISPDGGCLGVFVAWTARAQPPLEGRSDARHTGQEHDHPSSSSVQRSVFQ